MNSPILTLELRLEHDIVHARQRARQLAELLGFEQQDQIRIATAVSEMARNAFAYASGGKVELSVDAKRQLLVIRISDRGLGIADLQAVLEGNYRSKTGMGLGLIGTRRLMDTFEIESSAVGTRVTLGKYLPKRAPATTAAALAEVARVLVSETPASPLQEIQQQNRELLRTLDELREQRLAIAQVNRELEETNRGVVALYAELDERADYLQRANEIKTKFLSNMTHEFRTPLNSIINLTRLLLDRVDGELGTEQEKQVRFIARSAEDLSELVNDLLDLAKVEAGKIVVRPSDFRVSDMFSALRGILRPLLARNAALHLVIEEPDLPPLHTDEAKVSQILRNFISNAIKYTERGEVRVSARTGPDNSVVFVVSDTGIGIAPEDQERIFEEYAQVDSPLQRRVRGTGLGLPLSRRLAGLLGGSVSVNSTVGQGSTFYAMVPAQYQGPAEVPFLSEQGPQLDPGRSPVLVVEDNREVLFIYDKFLRGTRYQMVPARTVKEARQWLRTGRPVAIVLDVLLETESTWGLLAELRQSEQTRSTPILVTTIVDNEKRALELGADAFRMKPVEREWLLGKLDELTRERPQDVLLIVDDDPVWRYLLRSALSDTRYRVLEASTGLEGLRYAREARPRAVFLDIVMQGMDGFEVLEQFKSEGELRDIPVIIYTSKSLTEAERERLSPAVALVSKENVSREGAHSGVRSALAAAGLEHG